jgi:hypothetical protein
LGQRSRADFGLIVHRELGHTLWKVLVPLILIVFMAWTVFWIDPTLLPPQVGIATSSVLTLIAFNLSLGYLLPRISYLTRADRFILGCSVLVFLALGETVLTSRLAKTDRYDAALRVDRWSRWLYLAALAVIAAWSLWL